ncbi:unnamed protein product [Urochloa humidicola]
MKIVEPYLAWTEPQISEIYSVLKGSIRFYSVNGQDHNNKVLLQNQEQGSSNHLQEVCVVHVEYPKHDAHLQRPAG